MKHNQEALQQVFLHRESCFLICLYKVNEKLNVDLNQQGNKSLRNRHLTRLCPSSRGLCLSAPWDAGQEKYCVHHMMLRCFFAETGGRCWFLIMHMVTVRTILFILIKCQSTEVLYTPVLLRICSPSSFKSVPSSFAHEASVSIVYIYHDGYDTFYRWLFLHPRCSHLCP